MIYRLTGKLIEKTVENAVLDVNGMSTFILAVPQTVSGMLPEIGDEATLYTYLSVKEERQWICTDLPTEMSRDVLKACCRYPA